MGGWLGGQRDTRTGRERERERARVGRQTHLLLPRSGLAHVLAAAAGPLLVALVALAAALLPLRAELAVGIHRAASRVRRHLRISRRKELKKTKFRKEKKQERGVRNGSVDREKKKKKKEKKKKEKEPLHFKASSSRVHT